MTPGKIIKPRPDGTIAVLAHGTDADYLRERVALGAYGDGAEVVEVAKTELDERLNRKRQKERYQ